MVVHHIYYYLNVIHPEVILGIFLGICCCYFFSVCAVKLYDMWPLDCVKSQWIGPASVRYDRHRWLTLAAVLISLSVDHLFDVASVQQTWGVVVEGLERLAGAVGLLGGHAAVLAVAGWARVAALFLSPALGKWAVGPAFFHIHPARMTRCNSTRQPIGALARRRLHPTVSLLLSTWRAREGAHRDREREGGRERRIKKKCKLAVTQH